jgi:hypothetical protein
MAKIIHTTSNVPVRLIDEMRKLLWSEPDIVKRQMAIEWLVVASCDTNGGKGRGVLRDRCHRQARQATYGGL